VLEQHAFPFANHDVPDLNTVHIWGRHYERVRGRASVRRVDRQIPRPLAREPSVSHQDLGQMQMYVNYYDRHVKLPEENPTIGLLLCKEKKEAVVELGCK
jgi:hypothetical protein